MTAPHIHMKFFKKRKMIIWFSILLLLLPTVSAKAVTGEKAVLGVSSVFEERAAYVDLNVFLQSEEKIAGGSFDIEYDSTLMTIRDADIKTSSLLSNFLTSVNGAAAGNVSVAFANTKGESLNGTIVSFRARVSKAGETVSLKLNNVQLFDEKGTRIDVQLVDGQVKPFKGKSMNQVSPVDGEKVWTIKLSQPFNKATMNEHAVIVKNSRGIVVETEVTPASAISFKVKPKTPYAKGKYTIDITDQLRSANGAKLIEPVRFTFEVK